MLENDRVGVVLFRSRPAKADADTSIAYMRPIQNRHTALTIPLIRTPNGNRELDIWVFTGASPKDRPVGMKRSVLFPSIFKQGVRSLSFTKVEKESFDATAAFDMSSLMGLQHIFDMHCDKEITSNENAEDRLIVSTVYILAIRVAVDYFEKSAATMPEMHEKMSGVMKNHAAALSAAGIPVDEIDNFVRGCGAMASTFCVTAFKVSAHYMTEARRQLAMAGLSAILRTHIKSENGSYLGVHLVDDSTRELRMLSAYTKVAAALKNPIERDTMSMAVQECLLGGCDTIAKTLRLHAIEISPQTKCRMCESPISHMSIAVGRCHLCPHADDIVCEACLEKTGSCQLCESKSNEVDFERVAIESVSRAIVVMRENNKLRTEVSANKTKLLEVGSTLKKMRDLENEVARLTLENSDLRSQAKRDRRAEKKGTKDKDSRQSQSHAEIVAVESKCAGLASDNVKLTAEKGKLELRCAELVARAEETARANRALNESMRQLQLKGDALSALFESHDAAAPPSS